MKCNNWPDFSNHPQLAKTHSFESSLYFFLLRPSTVQMSWIPTIQFQLPYKTFFLNTRETVIVPQVNRGIDIDYVQVYCIYNYLNPKEWWVFWYHNEQKSNNTHSKYVLSNYEMLHSMQELVSSLGNGKDETYTYVSNVMKGGFLSLGSSKFFLLDANEGTNLATGIFTYRINNTYFLNWNSLWSVKNWMRGFGLILSPMKWNNNGDNNNNNVSVIE
jgi:hypothetical protein